MNPSRLLAFVGGITLIFSLFIPWVTHTDPILNLNNSVNGYSTDGAFGGLFGLFIILTAMVVKGKPQRRYSYLIAFFAVIAFYLTFRTITSEGAVLRQSGDTINSLKIGPFASMLGAVLAFVGGVMKVPPTIYDRKTTPPR
jgi:hypothetical protein